MSIRTQNGETLLHFMWQMRNIVETTYFRTNRLVLLDCCISPNQFHHIRQDAQERGMWDYDGMLAGGWITGDYFQCHIEIVWEAKVEGWAFLVEGA